MEKINEKDYCYFHKELEIYIIDCVDYSFLEYNLSENIEDDILDHIKKIIHYSFQSIKDMTNDDIKKYINIMLSINFTSYNQHFVKFLGKLLRSVNNQQEKGKLAEDSFFCIAKKVLPSLVYTGNVNFAGDFDDGKLFLFEIKNCSSYRSVHFEKFCRDMIVYYNKNHAYRIGILVHFYDDNFYDIDKNKIRNIDDLSALTSPFISIPFMTSLHCFKEILDKIETSLKRLCNATGYTKIYEKALIYTQKCPKSSQTIEVNNLKEYTNSLIVKTCTLEAQLNESKEFCNSLLNKIADLEAQLNNK